MVRIFAIQFKILQKSIDGASTFVENFTFAWQPLLFTYILLCCYGNQNSIRLNKNNKLIKTGFYLKINNETRFNIYNG